MDALWDLDRVPWPRLRAGNLGSTAIRVPGMLRDLASAPDATVTFARHEVQDAVADAGLVSEVTPYVVPYLFGLAVSGATPAIRAAALILLAHVARCDVPDGVEDEDALGEHVRYELLQGRSVLYALIGSPEYVTRVMALSALAAIDGNHPRLLWTLRHLERCDPDPRMGGRVREFRAEVESDQRAGE